MALRRLTTKLNPYRDGKPPTPAHYHNPERLARGAGLIAAHRYAAVRAEGPGRAGYAPNWKVRLTNEADQAADVRAGEVRPAPGTGASFSVMKLFVASSRRISRLTNTRH